MSDKIEIIKTPISNADIEQLENIELLFFAYRDFIGDADRILSDYSFGRAHHRALYFVSRSPGMTVADLLDILQITKQSLARVLRELVNSGYISQTTGSTDRRKRLLYPTKQGRELVLALSSPQSRRISKALKEVAPESHGHIAKFLRAMLDKD